MKCNECKHEGALEEDFEILEYESSTSTFDDYDQIFKLKCKKCNNTFTHVD